MSAFRNYVVRWGVYDLHSAEWVCEELATSRKEAMHWSLQAGVEKPVVLRVLVPKAIDKRITTWTTMDVGR